MTAPHLRVLALTLLIAACGRLPEVAVRGTALAKLDIGGQELPPHGGPWRCIRDGTTGLTWEVKMDDEGLHHHTWTYSWRYPRDAPRGVEGSCDLRSTGRCDTAAFIAAVNRERLCGYADWRLPTRRELERLVDADVPAPGPRIAVSAFPNTTRSSYWSTSSGPTGRDRPWAVNFATGGGAPHDPAGAFYVRLVRGPAPSIAGQPTGG